MADPPPRSAPIQGRLWGLRADDWAQVQEPQVAAAYGPAFDAAGVGPGVALLDAGCGAGLALRMAADRGARVSGVDASAPLLAIARDRVPGADLRDGDLEALPFDDGAFEVVCGFNAFQYAATPLRALAEAKRVLKPGGRLVIVTWGAPEGMEAAALIRALGPLLPPPPPGAPGPFALSSPEALASLTTSAGFTPSDSFVVRCDWTYPDEETALRGLNSSGVAARAIEAAGEAAVSTAHAQALAPFRRSDGGFAVGAAFLGLVATA